jgi:hypothetical protein
MVQNPPLQLRRVLNIQPIDRPPRLDQAEKPKRPIQNSNIGISSDNRNQVPVELLRPKKKPLRT